MYGDWVDADTLAKMADCNKRDLRGEDSLVKNFAISSDSGYKHILNATDEEWNRYYNRIRSHAISELRRIQGLKKKRVSERQSVLQLT